MPPERDTYGNPPGQERLCTNMMTGRETGCGVPDRGVQAGTTFANVRGVLLWLETWSDEEAQQVPIFAGDALEPGDSMAVYPGVNLTVPIFANDALEPGELYADLRVPDAGQLVPSSRRMVAEGELFVAKNEAPNDLWDRLVQRFNA